jgi:hypothetical protein
MYGKDITSPKDTVLILLLRDRLVEWMHRVVTDTYSFVAGDKHEYGPEEFWHVIEETIRAQENTSGAWYSHGALLDRHMTPSTSNWDVLEFAKAYSWSFVPWGADYTGLMIAFISADNDRLENAMVLLDRMGLGDLVVSRYSAPAVASRQFRGIVFDRISDLIGTSIWGNIAQGGSSALALCSYYNKWHSPIPDGIQTMIEVDAMSFGSPYKKAWVSVQDEAALLYCIRYLRAAIVLDATLSSDLRTRALDEFEDVARDPLHFGISALTRASWLYIPETERRKSEIFISNDEAVTRLLTIDPRITSAPYYSLVSYC